MKWLLPVIFLLILGAHLMVVTRPPSSSSQHAGWATYNLEQPADPRIIRYIESGDHWLGLSYGVAGAFAVFCFARSLVLRRAALTASAGGLTLSAVVWAAVCFLTGCCGSPMLPVYLGLFGPGFLQITKPLTFGLTLVSILAGYVWMIRRAPQAVSTNVDTRLHEIA